jgi:hypothetical protein
MANWVKCTRKADEAPIYLNLDTVMFLKWNELDGFTLVLLPGGKQNTIRVLERPEDILKADNQSVSNKTMRRGKPV